MAFYPQDSSDIYRIIKLADTALYDAKRSGRDKIVIYNKKMKIKED
jgi:PleD family two-component response regulator